MFKLKKKTIILVVVVILIIGGIYLVSARILGGKKQTIESVSAKLADLTEVVTTTGRVKSAESVDLAFERTGTVAWTRVKVGDHVQANTILASLTNQDLSAQLLQAQASLATEKARLNELLIGTRPEEIAIAESQVSAAEKILLNEQFNLKKTEEQAATDLESDYQAALSALKQAVSVAKNSILVASDIQSAHFAASSQEAIRIATTKDETVFSLLGVQNAGYWSTYSLDQLSGGAFGLVQSISQSSNQPAIDQALLSVSDALQKTNHLLEIIPVDTLSSTERTSMNGEKTSISAEITSISNKSQTILVQRATNSSAISAALKLITTAENNLRSAQDTLILKKAGTVPAQIDAQRARVQSAEASVQQKQAELAKTILRTPFAGIITTQDAKRGAIVAGGTPIISVISDAKFQIESNVPEADIAAIKVGNKASVTLDAYGSDVIFEASVITIDPAEILIEGVATYKVTMAFDKTDDRIKSGMTANIDISTAHREGVIVVPQRSLIRTNGTYHVRILSNSGAIEERPVTVGIRGSDGNREITSGLQIGEEVITFIKE